MEREITETKTFTHPGLFKIEIQISDLATGFAYRIKYLKQISPWYGYKQQAMLSIADNVYITANTAYDASLAPAFTPMLVEACTLEL